MSTQILDLSFSSLTTAKQQSIQYGASPVYFANGSEEVCITLGEFAEFSEEIRKNAKAIRKTENRKLRSEGVQGRWIDGIKVATTVVAVTHENDKTRLELRCKKVRWSELLALENLELTERIGLQLFKIHTDAHILAYEGDQKVLVYCKRGSRPGNPRMGSKIHIEPTDRAPQLTYSVAGTLDASVCQKGTLDGSWKRNAYKEMKEELGITRRPKLSFLGLAADLSVFKGNIGILGLMDTEFQVSEIRNWHAHASERCEVQDIFTVPFELRSFSEFFIKNRDLMLPAFRTGCLFLGERYFGKEFWKIIGE
ncbi:hypothetical protein HY990_06195 [Candidatus Micrarchaeota archaeon]|nr:hypothetical protein [Candidatus Micrarchaeota archaeon]